MLEYLRNAADKPWAKFLMFVLIFSFVGWGAASWIFGPSMQDTTLARVGNAEISLTQFNNERSNQMAALPKEEQRAINTDASKAGAFVDSVMAKLTLNQLALNRAKDLGFVVSDKRIADEIKSHPQFQYQGAFNPWVFEMMLQNSGLSEEDIANSLRADVLRSMTLGAVNVPVSVSDFALQAAYNARYAKRGVKYATVKYSDYKVSEPTNEQLKAYYAQNPVVVPETRSVSYVFVAADSSKPDAYDEGYKQMQKVEDMIISGDSMKDAAKKGNAKFVSLGKIKRSDNLSDKVLNSELIARLFAMDSGLESELIELKDGFLIMRVDEVHAEHNADFADVEKSLVNNWKKSEQRKKAYIDANEKLIAMKNGETLKDLTAANVSRTEGAPLVVLNAAFAGNDGDSLIVEDANAFYVVNVGKNVAPKMDSAKKESLRQELGKMTSRAVQDDYMRFLKKQYPVRVNQKGYDKLIAK